MESLLGKIWYYDHEQGIFMAGAEYIIKEALQSRFHRNLTIAQTRENMAQIH